MTSPLNNLPTGTVTIDNLNPQQKQTLTASNTIADADGFNAASFIYTWKSNGNVIAGATGNTYTLTQNDVGNIITVTLSYIDYLGTQESVISAPTNAVTNVNDLPTGVVFINNPTPSQGQTLTAFSSLTDADGIGAITYTWKTGTTLLGTGTTYTLGQADVGKAITVTASYTDGGNTVETVISAATANVINVNDAPTGSLTIDNLAPKQGDLLTAVNTLADADGMGAIITYTWKSNGNVIAGATNTTYTLAQSDVGKAITVTASYTDLLGTAESVTSTPTANVINVNDIPTGSLTISGVNPLPQQGDTLTAVSTLADLDGMGTVTYTWKSNGTVVGGTGSSYTLGQSDVGNAITVTANYTDGGGKLESITSAATSAILNVNDVPTGSVTLNNLHPQQGDLLTASNTLADIDGMGAVSYTWTSGGNIVGGTGNTYTLGQSDVGNSISVTAHYIDGQGTPESVPSLINTNPVINVNDAPTGIVSIDKANPQQGDTLTASDTLADIDGIGAGAITYTWKSGVTVLGTGTTYLLGQNDVGKAITVTANYTDVLGHAESVSSAPTTAVTNVNDPALGIVSINNLLTPKQGDVLVASNTLTDADGMGAITYTWMSGINVLSTGTTYTLGQSDVGKTIHVIASFTDGGGHLESVASLATNQIANVNDLPTGTVTLDNLNPAQGQTLTASNTLADIDGIGTITYTWKSGGVIIAGVTGNSYTLVQSDVGKAITVTASYTDLLNSPESVTSAPTNAVTNVNDLPTGTVTLSNTTPTQGTTLIASNTLADIDGIGAITHTWKSGGIVIAGVTGNSYTLAQSDVGKAITVTASYTDLFGQPESMTSAPTSAVTNVNDAPTGSVSINNLTPSQGQTLTAISTLADADGIGAITYTWKTGTTLLGTGTTYTLGQADVGKAITVTASYTDGGNTVETVISAATANVINVNDAPTGSLTIDNLAPKQGDLLTAVNTLADADGMGAIITYTWKSNGNVIAGATNTTYTLAQSDVGKAITVTASYTDLLGTAESVTSTPTANVINVNDIPTGSLTISGVNPLPQQGDTLTAVSTLADLDGMGTVTYTWKSNGTVVGGTGSSYTLGQSDVGNAITVTANYTDGGGKLESITSAATSAILNVNDVPTGSVTLNNLHPQQGDLLTASNTLADIDGMGAVSYTWTSGGNIVGGTGNTYTLGQSDVGNSISVTAHYIDGQGTPESVPSLINTNPVINVNDAPTGIVSIDKANPQQGDTLTASDTLADIDGIGAGAITYTWKSGVTVLGTGTTYLLGQNDVGKAITVTANYTDVLGHAESVSSAPTTAVTNVNDPALGIVSINNLLTPKQGDVLVASNTLTDADGMGAITYTWMSGINVLSTGTTYTLGQSDVGKTIHVIASFTDGGGHLESVASLATNQIANVNDLPTGTVTLDNLNPAQGQTLTASNTLADIDGIGTITYTWKSGGVIIAGVTGNSYTLVQSDVGKAITVTASYTDLLNSPESVTSAPTNAVTNVNDLPTGTVTLSNTTPTQGTTLIASNTLADIDGIGAITHTWKSGGIVIAGVTGNSYTLAQSDVGKAITVTASYTDLFGQPESMTSAPTSAVTNVNDAPTGSVSINNLTPSQGQTLTAISTLADADGIGAITYTWKTGTTLLGTGTTYTLGQADVGKAITVTASYTDGGNTVETVISAATANVINVNDAPTGSLTIDNLAPKQGDLLTAVNTLADADGMGAIITYTWKSNGNVIAGATNTTYTLAQSDVGKAITVTASYTDLLGTAESVTSTPTANVINVNDIPTGSLTISGVNPLPQQGDTLTAVSTLADLDGMGTVTYTWKSNGTVVGGTGSSYTLGQSDVGNAITVTANYTDGGGKLESITSAATSAILNVNDVPTGSVTLNNLHPQQGDLLTASNTLADIDGMGAVSYTWTSGGNIVGGTGNTYTLGQSDVGNSISVTAHYIDGQGTPESVPSLINTNPVINVNDAPTGIVSIDKANPQQGDTLTASDTLADIDGIGAGAITYTWKSGVTVLGTGTTYLLGQNDVGKAITVTANYTDVLGHAESVSSAPTTAVTNVNDPALGIVSINNLNPTQGQILVASNTLTDVDGLGPITYTWKSGSSVLGTGTTYTLGQGDVAKIITVTASYTDGAGHLERVTSPATLAVTNVNDLPTGTVTLDNLNPAQGQTLTASNTLADIDGIGTITYTWKSGGVIIAGVTGNSYTLVQSDVGKAITVTASYTDLLNSPESVTSASTNAVTNVNDLPTGGVTIDKMTPAQGDTLTASNTLADIDGIGAGAISYTWRSAGVVVGGAGNTYTLSQSDVGKVITVTASYTDLFGKQESMTSTPTSAVTNVNDAPTGILSISNTAPQQGDVLTAISTLADTDGMGVITYTWKTGITILGTGSTYTVGQSDVGNAITVTARYTDGGNTVETIISAATANVINVNDAPTGSLTIDNLAPKQGDLLTAVNTLADADGMGAIITYTWKSNGNVIAGATNTTYTLAQSDVGKAITVTASYTDLLGTAESVTSTPTANVINVNDIPTGSLTISGVNPLPQQGDTLTAVSTLADLDGMGTVTYTWKSNGTVVGGTGSSYTLGQSDVGNAITVTANYTDGGGKLESITSAATSAILNVNDVPTGSVTLNNLHPQQGDLLTASNTLADIDGMGAVSYTWTSGGNIVGGTGNTYTLGQSDVGNSISVTAHYIDGQGTPESVPSLINTNPVINVNDAPTGIVSIDKANPQQGDTLTASDTLADIDGIGAGAITYTWKSGVTVLGTGTTYLLGQNDVGKAITVTANYTDVLGHAESVSSAPTTAVTNVNDPALGIVSINNLLTPKQGDVLVASNTLTDADGMGAITYTWMSGINVLSTGTTYTLGQSDVGKTIHVIASFTDGGGHLESVASLATNQIANVNDLPTGTVTLDNLNPAQGQTLTASNTLADIDGIGTITYTWKSGGVIIAGVTGNSYTLVQSDVGKAITVTASYTDLLNSPESVTSASTNAVTNVNDLPTGGVTIDKMTPAQGDTLTASNTLADIDGIGAGAISYTWRSAGVVVGGAGNTYTLSQSDVGKVITVTASYTDLFGKQESMTSTPTSAVTNVNDAPTGILSISNTAPQQGDVLTAISTLADTDGMGVITYTWKTGITILGTGSTYTVGQSDVGNAITVTARYTDGGNTVETIISAATANVINVNDAPTGSLTIDNLAPKQGDLLTAVNTLADADGMGAIITYTWKSNGNVIAGATNTTYTLAQSDVGKAITVTASYTDLLGTAESVTSTPTANVINVNDIPTGSLTISGVNPLPQQGDTLTAVSTLADLDGMGTVTYTWKSNGTVVGGTGSSYTLGQSDVGNAITVTANYTDGGGKLESVTSAPTGAVINVNDLPTGSVIINNLNPQQGDLLTVSNTLADIDGMGVITYTWSSGGVVIAGVTGNTYTLGQGDVGKAISVTANYTDGQGNPTVVPSLANTNPVINVANAPTGSVTIDKVSPQQGDTLTASNTLADADGMGVITYTWKSGVTVLGTGTTYILGQSDVSKVITVTASYVDGDGKTESVTSTSTSAVANVNDAPIGIVTIDNITPAQGQTLTASNTLTDADGLGAITYTWKSGVAVLGTGTTYTLGQGDVGKAISVTASYTDGFGKLESVASTITSLVTNTFNAPTGVVTIDKMTPAQGQTLTASNTLADADGLGVITYTWNSNVISVVGTANTYTLTQSDVGNIISVTASYTDGDGTLESVISSFTSPVANVNDLPTGSVTIDKTTPAQGDTLIASNTLADIDGIGLGAITYTWKTGVTILGTGATYILGQSDVGNAITVTASYIDLLGQPESMSSTPTSAVTNINDAPTGSLTISTATPKQGDVLSFVSTLADADGLGAITYTWKSGAAVLGTGATYTLSQNDVGKAITVTASYTDGFGKAESMISVPTGLVANVNDLPVGSVIINNTTPKQGDVLTASNTITDVDGLGTISYIWKSGAVVVGGSGNTYTLTQSDVGKAITVTAIYTDAFGQPETVSSAPTASVANVNDLPTGGVTIDNITPAQGQTLTAITTTLADADGLGPITYTWKSGTTVVGGTGNTYVLTQSDVGKAMTVKASYTDLLGTAESVTSTATSAVTNVNDLPAGSVTISSLTPTQGDVLTVSNTLTDVDGMGVVTYTWMSGANAVATGNTYTLLQSDVGKVITVIAKYTDGFGRLESVPSTPTSAVADLNDAPVLATPANINYTDTQYVDNFTTVTGTLLGTDVDSPVLTYGVTGTGVADNGATLSISNAYGTLTVTKATGAYTFVPNSAGIEPLSATATTTFTVTVSDGLLTASKLLTVAIAQSGTTETNGDDNLVGTTGADTWAGLLGNDVYTVNNVGDTIIENVGGGADAVYSSISYTLSANLEALVLTGGTAVNATGNAQNNNMFGNALNNVIDGGAGADYMVGGLGDDGYIVDNVGDIVAENANEGFDSVDAYIDYTLTANVERLVLMAGAIRGTGNTLTNYLNGNSANNILDGGLGADVMLGYLGDDSYYVDDIGDSVIEALGEGIDTVYSSISYTLAANVEALVLTGTAGNTGWGNGLDNQLTGNSGDNILWGGAGIDTMAGGLGNDSYNVDNTLDVVNENAGGGFDIVYSTAVNYTLSANVEQLILAGTAAINGAGNADNNNLYGNTASNILDGGAGADYMAGGLGSDGYVVESAGDVVFENANEGFDSVDAYIDYTLTANVERLVLMAGAIRGTGNTLTNYLNGNSANNILDGGLGADVMLGYLGDDSYYVDDIGDSVIEALGEGIDTVYSSISYTLAANVEALVLTGTAGNTGWGNGLDNQLTGNSGDNILWGGAGIDTMAGGLGNDSYNVDNTLDVVNENAGGGFDIVYSTAVNYTLSANVEQLILAGTAAINGAGNADNNNLIGNTANNTLTGGDGADTLTGGLGADTYDLTETVAATDTLRIATGDSTANHDIANNFKLGTGLGNTVGVDRLDLDTTTIAFNAAAVNGINAGNIMSHSITNGIISFGGTDSYTSPLTISAATDLANVIAYLQNNVTGGSTVAFIADTNNTYVFQDGGATDTLVELVGVTATSVNNSGLVTDSVWII